MLEDVGDEICEATQLVYLGTVSRVLPGNAAAYRGIGTEAAPVTGVLAPDFSAVGGFRHLMDARCEVCWHRGRRVIL